MNSIEGSASLCVIFHSWNFTNMLISHSAFFSHAKRFHFFSFFIFHIFLSHANHPLPTVQWALRMRPVVNDSDGAGATLVFVTCQHDVCRATAAAGSTCDWKCQCYVNWRVGISRDQKKRRGIWTVAMFITKSINHETLIVLFHIGRWRFCEITYNDWHEVKRIMRLFDSSLKLLR